MRRCGEEVWPLGVAARTAAFLTPFIAPSSSCHPTFITYLHHLSITSSSSMHHPSSPMHHPSSPHHQPFITPSSPLITPQHPLITPSSPPHHPLTAGAGGAGSSPSRSGGSTRALAMSRAREARLRKLLPPRAPSALPGRRHAPGHRLSRARRLPAPVWRAVGARGREIPRGEPQDCRGSRCRGELRCGVMKGLLVAWRSTGHRISSPNPSPSAVGVCRSVD